MSTMVPLWEHDSKNIVIVLSWVCRKSVVLQSCVNRTTIVSCLGLFFRFSCHGMRVLLSCHCPATVVRLLCSVTHLSEKYLETTRLHLYESNDINGRFPLQLLYQCTILTKHHAPFDPWLTNQCPVFRWFLYCSRVRINAYRTIFCPCWNPGRRLFSRTKHNRSDGIAIL